MIKIGDTNISELYIGKNRCLRAYQGTTIVYEADAYITFTSNTSGSTIGLVSRSSKQTTLEYSRDKITWTDMTTGMTPETLDSGEELYVRGVLTGANSSSNYTQFDISNGDVSVSGDIRNLWNYNNLNQPLNEEAGRHLFTSCVALTDASNLCMPIANAFRCYYLMFQYCTSLTTVPQLPSTALASACYGNMFQGCTSLITVPSNMLPATELFEECYIVMFNSCTSLTNAPELPATTLADYCYNSMFSNCSGLTTAPELSATTLANYCYTAMFRNCTSLTHIKCLATNISANNCTHEWVKNVAGNGTFIKDPSMSSWTTGYDGIPSGWNVVDNT